MSGEFNFDRVCLLVLDSVGIGAMPDAAAWGDAGSDTLGHIAENYNLSLPNLAAYGLGSIRPLRNVPPAARPRAAYGRCALLSNGKDTTTGHWEIAGIILDKAFPTYPHGFPPDVIESFVRAANVPGVLGNKTASGTEIIEELGAEHIETGKLIVYTSADSVFQIAAHEEMISINRLYEMCERAREILRGEHEVGRVIARPFEGVPGAFQRTERRHDYAVAPPTDNLLVKLQEKNLDVITIGKVASVYDGAGVTQELAAKNNDQSIDQTINALKSDSRGLIFSNLVDFDMLYGHRRDIGGYARALEHFDERLPQIESALRSGDLLIITADHGNDPTYKGADHTREYTPLLVYGEAAQAGVELGTRRSLADIGQTIADNFNLRLSAGESFLRQIVKES